MRKLHSYTKNIFSEFELTEVKEKKIFPSEAEAVAARDILNITLILDTCTTFILKYGGKLNYYFGNTNLQHAKHAKDALQKFVTGTNNLRRKNLASGIFVYCLVDEFVLSFIGHLEHARQPYANDYGEMLNLFNEFAKQQAPPLFSDNEIYHNSPAMRDFYQHA